MSRSAAEWNQQSQQQPNPTYPMMGIAPPQPAQLINGVYTTVMQQPYGMVPMQHVPYGSVPIGQPYGQVPVGQPYGAVPIMPPPPQPFVPIPLTGWLILFSIFALYPYLYIHICKYLKIRI
jgi:hypothetical protein